MARPITTRRPSGQRINGSAAPAMALATPMTPWLRNAVLCVATGIAALAAGQLTGHITAGWAALIASVPIAVLIGAYGRRKQLRRQLADRLLQAVAPQLGLRSLDRRAVNATRWSRGWPGIPTQIVLRYAPVLDDVDPQWQHDILTSTSRLLLERYRIDVVHHQRCWLRLQLAGPVEEEDSAPAVQVRAERTISELIGPTAAITRTEFVDGELVLIGGHHQAGAKLAASGYRARIERVLSTMLPGRWRAHWDMENDGFRFELRPSFPPSIWLPVSTNPDGHDVLASYDSLAIPYGVDEDGEVMVWRPAIDPNLMLVGAPGVGKSLATSTPIPTPSGWTTMGELAAGDVVFDDRGRPCTVVTGHPVRHDRPCYRVAFSDGSTVLVDGEHLWSTSTIAERTSRRRWEARRHEDQRPTRMGTEQLAVLRTAVEHCGPEDLISVPEAARLAGIRPSAPVLRLLRRQLPGAGQRLRPMHDFSYAEQVVESVQTVNAYPRRPLLEQIAAAVAAGRGSLPPQRAQHLLQLASVDNNDLISTPQLKQLLDLDYPDLLRLLRLTTVPATKRQETVRGLIPAHVQRRRLPGPSVELYPKRQLLEALLEWGSGRVKDGKPARPTSSVRTTEQIAATLIRNGKANHAVAVAGPIQCPPADLPLSPYALGVWLGDGNSWQAQYTSADPEIAVLLEAEGIEVADLGRPRHKPETYLAHTYAMREVRRPLEALELLRRSDPARRVRGKHIPPMYLRASIEQRRALLAGLMDTDGTVSPQGTCQFTNTAEQLARDVHELACSLGFRATITPGRSKLNERDCGPKWTVAWTTTDPVFRLKRKQLVHKARTTRVSRERSAYRYITAVEPVDSVPVRCITVDSPTRLYLVGDTFIPTHNTVTAHTILVQATRHGWPVWVVDGKSIEFLGFQSWPNVQIVGTSIEQQVAIIHRAWEVMERRYELITTGQARESDFEPLLVFLDEWADFRANLMSWYAGVKVKGDPTKPLVLIEAGSLARKGRTSRVHLVFGTQRPDAEYFGGDMRDNFRMRVSMGRLSPQGAMMMWESPTTGTSIPRGCRGRATTINDDNRAVEIQTYRTPDPRKTLPGSDEAKLLDQLRPAKVVHDRLLIVPPRGELDIDTSEVDEPTYSDYATAQWVRAVDRPDLDPVQSRLGEHVDGRTLASPMTVFGLTDAPATSSGRAQLRLVHAGAAAAAGAPRPALPPEEEEYGYDPFEGYGFPTSMAARALTAGDLVLVDEDEMTWGVLDEDPTEDLEDEGYLALSWRSDDDDSGVLSVPTDHSFTVRRPTELQE